MKNLVRIANPSNLHENLPNAPKSSKKRRDKRKSQKNARKVNRK